MSSKRRTRQLYSWQESRYAGSAVAACVMGFVSMLMLIGLTIAGLAAPGAAWIGALGVTAFVIAFIGLRLALRSFHAQCRSYLLSKLGAVYCGVMVGVWFLVFCLGLAGMNG